MLGAEDLKAGSCDVGEGGSAIEGDEGGQPSQPHSLASGLSWPAAETIQNPHLIPCHTHVYFRTQMTVPKAMWHWKAT